MVVKQGAKRRQNETARGYEQQKASRRLSSEDVKPADEDIGGG